MTRVLVLYNALGVGGAERSLAALVPRLRDRGFEPFVATLRARGRYFEELRSAGIACEFLDMRSRWHFAGAVRAYRLHRLGTDVVLTHSIDADLLGHFVARRRRLAHVTVEQGGVGIPRRHHRRLLTGMVAPHVDGVVAVTSSQVPDLRRLGYRSDRIRVVPNGVGDHRPARPVAEVRKELGYGTDDVVAALVAGLRPEKRPDVFVEAVARARARNPRIRGLVVGGGTERGSLEPRARAADVQLLGERADVADLMAAADAVCLSSDVEGLPLAVVEAMCLARPVIATDVGGLRDAVVPGITGWLVPRGDHEAYTGALLELAADAEGARAMGERGRSRYVERFSADAMADGYAQLLHEVVASRRPPRRRA